MSVISFWNQSEKENGQTSALLAIATYMAIEHNYRILVIDATFDDNTMEKAFWKKKENKTLQQLTGGKIDISSGAEGLVSAVASNKATPEIITNYTKIVFKNRLDILLGLKTKIPEEQEKSLMLYKELIIAANKYYDLIFVDVNKGYKRASSKALLEQSNLIIYAMPPNLVNINNYLELSVKDPIVKSRKVLPLLSKSDISSSYNVKNTTRYMKQKSLIPAIPYNVRFMEATNEAKLADFFLKTKISNTAMDINGGFISEISRTCSIIIEKLKELNR